MRNCAGAFMGVACVLVAATGCLRPNDGEALPLAVQITSPTETTYERARVDFTFEYQGLPETVTLLADGEVVGEISPPFNQFSWDVGLVPEGDYKMTALAVDSEGDYAVSDPVEVWVDRSAPFMTQLLPNIGATDAALYEPIIVFFNEPVVDYTVHAETDQGVDLAGVLELRPDEVSLRVTFHEPPAIYPANISIVIEGTDRAGNPITQPSGGWEFTAPATIGQGSLNNVVMYDSALDAAGRVVIARWDGSEITAWRRGMSNEYWEQLGAAVTTQAPDQLFVETAPAGDYQYVAWRSGGEAYVMEFNGMDWNPIGADLGAGITLDELDFTINAANNPVIATSNAGAINTHEWNGSSWFTHIDSPGSGTQLSTIVAGSYPWVVYQDPAGIGITRYDADGVGGYWFDVGTGILGSSGAQNPTVFIDLNEVAHAAYQSAGGSVEVYRWDMAWSQVGGALGTNVTAGPTLVADIKEKPIVSWVESGVGTMFARWDGTQWIELTGELETFNTDGSQPKLSFTPLSQFAVTWQDQNTVHAARVNGIE